MTPLQPWFAANVSIENIDTVVLNMKLNNGRKITNVILITTNCHLWQYQVLLQTMEQESSKNQNPPAILNLTKNLMFCPFSRGYPQHHRNRDQNWPRECFRDAGHLSWTHPYSAHSWGSEQVWGGFLCQNWIYRALFHLAPSLNTTRWHWFQLLCPVLVKLNECSDPLLCLGCQWTASLLQNSCNQRPAVKKSCQVWQSEKNIRLSCLVTSNSLFLSLVWSNCYTLRV